MRSVTIQLVLSPLSKAEEKSGYFTRSFIHNVTYCITCHLCRRKKKQKEKHWRRGETTSSCFGEKCWKSISMESRKSRRHRKLVFNLRGSPVVSTNSFILNFNMLRYTVFYSPYEALLKSTTPFLTMYTTQLIILPFSLTKTKRFERLLWKGLCNAMHLLSGTPVGFKNQCKSTEIKSNAHVSFPRAFFSRILTSIFDIHRWEWRGQKRI